MNHAALMQQLIKAANSALDLLFPLNCERCNKEGKLICDTCVQELPRLSRPFCEICAQPGAAGTCDWCLEIGPAISGLRAPFLMEGSVRRAVHSLKYRGVRAATPELASLMAQYLESQRIPGDVLVPVPLHRRRLRNRGYNQASLLARELGKLTGLTVMENLLERTSDSPPQIEATSRAERRSNVEGIFRCMGQASGFKVLLIDDVATTGSTLQACAVALRDAGAESVWGLTLARER